jgi:hypothetical protein
VKKLHFSPEQCASLGLEADESLRLLASGSKTVLLERVDTGAGQALPWDRDLVLVADVKSFALADVLNLLHASCKSGFLFFEHQDHAKSVYLHRGEVVFATSNQTFDRLGECLMRSGAISSEQLEQVKLVYRPPGQFGKLLVERGLMSPRELWNGVKLQVEEIVRSLFSYGAGSVLFWEGEIAPDNVVRLSLPTRRLIAEGLKRRDDLLKFVALLEAPRVRVDPVRRSDAPRSGGTGEGTGGGPSAGLTGSERALYEAFRSGEPFSTACRTAGVEPLCGARTVKHLRLLGAVDLTPLSEDEASNAQAERRGDDDTVRDTVMSHVKLFAEYAAPLVAMEGDVGIRERLGLVAQEASRRYPELLAELEVGAGGVLDPEWLIERALRYPGDREGEVRLALGELVSYLEFEIVNHPRIPDAEDFLVPLEELRARL